MFSSSSFVVLKTLLRVHFFCRHLLSQIKFNFLVLFRLIGFHFLGWKFTVPSWVMLAFKVIDFNSGFKEIWLLLLGIFRCGIILSPTPQERTLPSNRGIQKIDLFLLSLVTVDWNKLFSNEINWTSWKISFIPSLLPQGHLQERAPNIN